MTDDSAKNIAPLSAGAGKPSTHPVYDDPLDAFADLMQVVEALCPRWPAGEITTGTDFRL
ncbi:MAG: hypothetical protein KDI75_02385 [Xanthomonadales bacterium]|nr:hypothetical protein [Xanthomonadales bacterium]